MVAGAEAIEGIWEKADKSAQIKISVSGGSLSAKIHSVADKSRTHDTNNPDASKRGNKLLGLQIASGFSKEGDKWSGGSVYDSRSGKYYSGKMWLEGNDNLTMRAFKGVSLLGKSAKWTRVK